MTSVAATFCATLVDEWVRAGVTDAVVCPGSRSTPLALALAARPELSLHVKLDERSAVFFAVGCSLESEMPTVICTTSGTAAAELHAGVVEAHQSKVPLIVCTADRPIELHHVGASQTIDQEGLFTTATRWAVSPGVPDAATSSTWRPLGARAFAEAVAGPYGAGPVHLNLAFREPLLGEPADLPDRAAAILVRPRPADQALAEPLGGRGVLIAGGGAGAARDTGQLAELARVLRWPLLADPRSGRGPRGPSPPPMPSYAPNPPPPRLWCCSALRGSQRSWLRTSAGAPRPGRGSSPSIRGGNGPIPIMWSARSTPAMPMPGWPARWWAPRPPMRTGLRRGTPWRPRPRRPST